MDALKDILSKLSKPTLVALCIIFLGLAIKFGVNIYEAGHREVLDAIKSEGASRYKADTAIINQITRTNMYVRATAGDVSIIKNRQDKIILKMDVMQKEQRMDVKNRLDLIDTIYNLRKNENGVSVSEMSHFMDPMAFVIEQPEGIEYLPEQDLDIKKK